MSHPLSFDSVVALLGQHPAQWTAALLVLACGWAMLAHHLAATLNEGRHGWQRRVRAWLGVAQGKAIGELRWLLLSMHLFLWPGVAYVLLHVWGEHEAGEGLTAAIFSEGFKVGSTTVVPGKLLLGALSFIVLFTFTRWLKAKLEHDWLPRVGVEASTREAVATLFGYATFVIAAIVGLSSAGLDFTKLAIVAGALSVGIGFGLQNVVSNFVSGLILLFEQPVRIGDIITVGGNEGFVRKMRIRATEIETFDRETIIVPNSDLLSNAVRNRNLRTMVGRIVLPVGVSYRSDPEQVRDLLLAVAAAHPAVLSAPAPFVQFKNFGASSLDFELFAHVHEANARGDVASDLRFAIFAAFREANIQIPFPQQDVHLYPVTRPDATA
ncbi:MAG TPA: mechanosensitive ion channel domain-containing protein [Solimonas sp.]|nr:mechanosensitive ion channel domain-containing protein [Solimonas sp.]